MRPVTYMMVGLLWSALLRAQSPSEKPSAYCYVSVSYQFPKYSDPLNSRVRFIERVPGMVHIPVRLDVGYYRPINDKLLWGPVIQLGVDRYSDYGNHLQVDHYHPSVSICYFLDELRGSGMFIRGDVGPIMVRRSSGDDGTESVTWGAGFLAASGFAMKIGDRSILVSLDYSYSSTGSGGYQFIGIGLGSLF